MALQSVAFLVAVSLVQPIWSCACAVLWLLTVDLILGQGFKKILPLIVH